MGEMYMYLGNIVFFTEALGLWDSATGDNKFCLEGRRKLLKSHCRTHWHWNIYRYGWMYIYM